MIVSCRTCGTQADGDRDWCEQWRDCHHQMGHTTTEGAIA